jgi:hypothetical protein
MLLDGSLLGTTVFIRLVSLLEPAALSHFTPLAPSACGLPLLAASALAQRRQIQASGLTAAFVPEGVRLGLEE